MQFAQPALLALGLAGALLGGNAQAQNEAIKLGTKPENFTLSSPAGGQYSLFDKNARAKATVVIFIATRCPVSLDYDGRMAELGSEYKARGVRFIGVNANSSEPGPEVADHAKKHGFTFPVVKDPNNAIADRFGARVTPEAYVLDKSGTLVYHGRIDDSQNPANVKTHDLKLALDAVLEGRTPSKQETRAFGCGIKRAH